jgi:uncharacterized hydantoinase/oxoprolinase family protein
LRLSHENPGQPARWLVNLAETIKRETLTSLLGVVDEVVEANGKLSDIFTVERGHERLIQGIENVVGYVIPTMLELAQRANFVGAVRPVFKDFRE